MSNVVLFCFVWFCVANSMFLCWYITCDDDKYYLVGTLVLKHDFLSLEFRSDNKWIISLSWLSLRYIVEKNYGLLLISRHALFNVRLMTNIPWMVGEMNVQQNENMKANTKNTNIWKINIRFASIHSLSYFFSVYIFKIIHAQTWNSTCAFYLDIWACLIFVLHSRFIFCSLPLIQLCQSWIGNWI